MYVVKGTVGIARNKGFVGHHVCTDMGEVARKIASIGKHYESLVQVHENVWEAKIGRLVHRYTVQEA